jgi:DNA helicase II / ATP-dependent DNA helicase PcrA
VAESGDDEGPVCNLSLISQYLARFVDDFIPIFTADLIVNDIVHRVFYYSFLFALYRLGESEYEDAEDPFPKGRIPFLTIHQSKGLEFPVVVLGNPRRQMRGPGFTEKAVRPFSSNEGSEPLDRQAEFDTARMFYVALSRAQNLLVIAHFKGPGQFSNKPFNTILNGPIKRIPDLALNTMPSFSQQKNDLPSMYSYTADYLAYQKCPRQYMLFRKYGFVPSRAQTMMFGSLVHRTLEDLHHEIIRRRTAAEKGERA